jgi:hypothetical protein
MAGKAPEKGLGSAREGPVEGLRKDFERLEKGLRMASEELGNDLIMAWEWPVNAFRISTHCAGSGLGMA